MVRARLSELRFENRVDACVEYLLLPHESRLLWPNGGRGEARVSSKPRFGEIGDATLVHVDDGDVKDVMGDLDPDVLEASLDSKKSSDPI
jgi:hypothetical protein